PATAASEISTLSLHDALPISQPLEHEGGCRAVLRLALLHFATLLGDVQVQGPAAPERLRGDVADPLRRTSPHAVRRRAHRNLAREGIEVLEVFVGRFLDEALLPRVVRNAESAPRVRDAQEDGAQAGFLRGAR